MSHDPTRTAKNTLKPLGVPGAATKTNANTPNLNKQKASRASAKQAEADKKAMEQIVPAAEIKALDWSHPARQAYNREARNGGAAASLAFRQAMQQSLATSSC
jgi:hypothetical protein